MKNCKIILLFVAAFWSYSCSTFLDTKPLDRLSPVNYYETAEQLQTALVGVYDILGDASVYGTDWWYRLGVSTDESFFRNPTNRDVRTLIITANDVTVTNTWNALYQGINRANALLDAMEVDANGIDAATVERVQAEAKFLRGYFYFLLVSSWGDVPLRLKTTTTVDDNLLPRSSIEEVYEQVMKDMMAAETVLPSATELGPTGSGRVSKTTAQGILARVSLTMAGKPLYDESKFEDAKSWALKVMESGEHTLNSDYKQIFINHTQELYDPKECMWEVEFSYDPGLTFFERGSLGYLNSIKSESLDSGFSTALIAPTKKLWDLYTNMPDAAGILTEERDNRRDWNIAPFYYMDEEPEKGKVYWSSTEIYSRYAGKWRRTYEVGPMEKFYTYINFPILRYSDVLLMFAEAENELNGPSSAAQSAINQVRRRGWGLDMNTPGLADLPPIAVSSKETFRETVQDERARELCFEGLRTADLKRWGLYVSALKETANDFSQNGGSFRYGMNAGNNVEEKHQLLPIPSSELSINRAVTQNPGY